MEGSWRGQLDCPRRGWGLLTPSRSVVLRAQLSLFLPFVPALGLIGKESFQGFSPPLPTSSPHPPPGCEGDREVPGSLDKGALGFGLGASFMDIPQPLHSQWFPLFPFPSPSRPPGPGTRMASARPVSSHLPASSVCQAPHQSDGGRAVGRALPSGAHSPVGRCRTAPSDGFMSFPEGTLLFVFHCG